MTICRVPVYPPAMSADGVRSGQSISGHTHQAIASGVNFALGRGGVLIPWHDPGSTVLATATNTYRYKFFPRHQAYRRRWVVDLAADAVSVSATVTAGSASAVTVTSTGVYTFTEIISSRTSSETAVNLVIENNHASVDMFVNGVYCDEVPLASLPGDGTDYGVDIETARAGAPIFDGTGVSLGGIVDSVAQLETVSRRNAYWAWAVDTTDARVLDHTDALHSVPLLARKLYRTSTTGTITGRIYAKTSTAATAGTFGGTTTSGNTLTFTIPINSNAAFAWFNATVSADCEDLTASDGRRSSQWDGVTTAFTRTAGAGTLSVASEIYVEA